MHIQAGRLALVAAILGFGLGSGGLAEAGAILPTPPGLSPGAHFRFAIVSDGTTTGIPPEIGTYNNFVNGDTSGATYNGSVVSWFAVASTDTVSAIDNIGQSQDPVYLVNGTQVTTSTTTSGLWSGALLHPIDVDVSGSVTSASEVWTGTNPDGTGTKGFTLGNSTGLAEVGSPGLSDFNWARWDRTRRGPLTLSTRSRKISSLRDLPSPSRRLSGCSGSPAPPAWPALGAAVEPGGHSELCGYANRKDCQVLPACDLSGRSGPRRESLKRG